MPIDVAKGFKYPEITKEEAQAVYLVWKQDLFPDTAPLEMSRDLLGVARLFRDRVVVNNVHYRVIKDNKERIVCIFKKKNDPDYIKVKNMLQSLLALANS